MADENIHTARRQHVRVCREDEWGQCPAAPEWQPLPLTGRGFRAGTVTASFSPETPYDGWRRQVRLEYLREVAGSLTAPLYPQVTDCLLGMALDRTAGRLDSYCIDHFRPGGPRRHLGCRVRRAVLACEGPGEEVVLHVELAGREEQANASLAEGDFDYAALSAAPFRFGRASFTLDGAPMAAGSFRLEVSNHLRFGPARQGRRSWLHAGKRPVRVEALAPDAGPALSEALRTGAPIPFTVTFNHPGGHELAVSVPRLHVESCVDRFAPGRVVAAAGGLSAAGDATGTDIEYTLTT